MERFFHLQFSRKGGSIGLNFFDVRKKVHYLSKLVLENLDARLICNIQLHTVDRMGNKGNILLYIFLKTLTHHHFDYQLSSHPTEL